MVYLRATTSSSWSARAPSGSNALGYRRSRRFDARPRRACSSCTDRRDRLSLQPARLNDRSRVARRSARTWAAPASCSASRWTAATSVLVEAARVTLALRRPARRMKPGARCPQRTRNAPDGRRCSAERPYRPRHSWTLIVQRVASSCRRSCVLLAAAVAVVVVVHLPEDVLAPPRGARDRRVRGRVLERRRPERRSTRARPDRRASAAGWSTSSTAGFREFSKQRKQGSARRPSTLDGARRAMRAAYQREMDALERASRGPRDRRLGVPVRRPVRHGVGHHECVPRPGERAARRRSRKSRPASPKR